MKIIYGIIALLFGTAKDKLAEYDHERELERNTQLLAASKKRQQEALEDSFQNVSKRIKILRHNLFLSLLSMVSAVAVGAITVHYNMGIPTPQNVLIISSAFCFAWATLGRLGWAAQSYKGDSSVEKLDDFLFHALYWFGMYLATVSTI